MSCSGGKSSKKGNYNKKINLKNPTGYKMGKKGELIPIYNDK